MKELLKGPVRSKGPKGDRIWDLSQKSEVIPFPPRGIHAEAQKRFPKETHQFFGRPLKDKDFTKIDELVEKGVITPGKAPKTKKSTLDAKKDRGILLRDADEDILRIKRENKEAIERFKKKMKKDDPDKFQYGGIAPMIGEPSYAANFYDDRTPMAGGALVKGGRWFLKSLYDTKKQLMQLDIPLSKKQELMKQADDAIKQIEGGAPIPEQIIQHIRKDPKFKSVSQGPRATDPDLAEMEEVILEYGKRHAEGGRIGYAGGGIFKLLKMLKSKPKSNKLSEQDVVALKKKHGLDPESLKKDDEAFKLRLQQILAKHSTKHAEGGRIEYAGGGKAGLPAITQETQTPQMNMQGPQMPSPTPQPAGVPGVNLQQNQMDLMQQKMEQNPWMQDQMKQGMGGMQKPQYKGQFRMPFGLGGISRRAFMKMMAGAAALPFIGKGITKMAPKAVPKVAETIVQSNAAGMPAWFPKLVERVIKEGDDVTRKAGSEAMERQTIHRATTPEGTPIEVMQDLTSGNVIVDIGEQTKHGWSAGRHGQPTRLVLKKGEWIEPTKGKKGIKTKDEFIVDEAEFTGGHPENVKFEETVQFKYGDHGSDFSEIEQYATKKSSFSGDSVGEVSRSQRREGWRGKKEQARQLAMDKKYGGLKSTYKKDPHVRGKQADRDAWAEGRAEVEAEDVEFASGGIARLLGE